MASQYKRTVVGSIIKSRDPNNLIMLNLTYEMVEL